MGSKTAENTPSLPLQIVERILRYTDAATIGRAHQTCKVLHRHLTSLRPNEQDRLWSGEASAPVFVFVFADERVADRLRAQRRWERVALNNNNNNDNNNDHHSLGFKYKIKAQLAPVEPLNAAILAAMKRAKLASANKATKRVAVAVNDTNAYMGATKALHVHLTVDVPATSTAVQSPLVLPRSTPLLFLQSAQPRNLQITNLLTYARVPLLHSVKKPFVFRILNWTHTPFIYFVDRDTYQRRMWYYDSAVQSILPVVAVSAIPEVVATNEEDAPAVPAEYSLIDPFAHVVDMNDASVNDNFAGFGNVVVWWTWVGGRRRNQNHGNEAEEEEGEEEEEDDENEGLEPGQRRGPRRYELKVHAYEVSKESDVEGAGIRVKVKQLWEERIHLTSSQNLSAHMTNNRLHIFHHKKFLPKTHAEIVAKYSFNLTPEGGLNLDETIIEPVREPVEASPDGAEIVPQKERPATERELIGSRANNQRVYTRFHCLEFHNEFDFFKPDGSAIGEGDDDENTDMNISGYGFPSCDKRLFTGRDASLGNTPSTAKQVDQDVATGSGGLVLSLVPIVKNIWRPGKRQISEDGRLLVVAGVEGSRRCLRVVDIANGDAESGLVHAFYLDDETGALAPDGRKRKKVGGGVWVVELDDSPLGWSVLFVECGGVQ
ncbi:hypothetical protein HDU79_002414 [Rhizoclosmatium sp. JEL0117]|nr:hypothetical protein HDU79_002414 [Rhizoclosmatium sp. JEL0117]